RGARVGPRASAGGRRPRGSRPKSVASPTTATRGTTPPSPAVPPSYRPAKLAWRRGIRQPASSIVTRRKDRPRAMVAATIAEGSGADNPRVLAGPRVAPRGPRQRRHRL